MKTHSPEFPFKWPFPPKPKTRPRSRKPGASVPGALSWKAKVADVVLVVVWGATIPGLMWLGAAGGF